MAIHAAGLRAAESWPTPMDSLARTPTAPDTSSASTSTRLRRARSKPWFWRRNTPIETSAPSRSQSVASTRSSVSTRSTVSSVSDRPSNHANVYQLPEILSQSTTPKHGRTEFHNAIDATLALASLAEDILPKNGDLEREDDVPEAIHNNRWHTRRDHRAHSAASTIPKASSTSRHSPANTAEIEMLARSYHGYWRPAFSSTIPAAAAICGALLLTARLGTEHRSITSRDAALQDQAHELCLSLSSSENMEDATRELCRHGLETAIACYRASLDSAEMIVVPEKPAWAIYKKLAHVNNHPEKLPSLWQDVSKLLKCIPSDIMVVIMFSLAVAKRLESHGVTIDGRSPALYLLRKLWPRYVSEDVSRLLALHYDDLPLDLPQVLEAVNHRFSDRRCNLMTLEAEGVDIRASSGAGRYYQQPFVESNRGLERTCQSTASNKLYE